MTITLFTILAYLFGSIPFGVAISKYKGIDITKTGSGNIGASNVARSCGFKFGAAVLMLDGLKGLIPLLIAKEYISSSFIFLIPLASIAGHMFSVFIKFKGGKGFATMLITYIGIEYMIALGMIAAWLATFLWTKYSSVATLISLHVGLILSFLTKDPALITFTIISYAMIVYKHKSNIMRIINKVELRF